MNNYIIPVISRANNKENAYYTYEHGRERQFNWNEWEYCDITCDCDGENACDCDGGGTWW